MKQKSILAFILLFSILITGCSSKNKSTEETINDTNILNSCNYQTIGDIVYFRPSSSYGATMDEYCKLTGITTNDIIYDEKTDKTGKLLNDKIYVIFRNTINNATDKKINVNLEDFYLVIRGKDGRIKRGSTKPRHAYLEYSENTTLDNFKLTLEPNGKSTVQIVYIEELDNLKSYDCFYRVKSNENIKYFNIHAELL